MATIVKTWAFASDAEGLADEGVSGFITFTHQAGDGTPSGCVEFNDVRRGLIAEVERARRPSTGETWQTWGVPAGATVTAVQITAWRERTVQNTKLSAHTIRARVVGSGGSTVHSAGELLDVALATGIDASWQTPSAGTSRAVDGGSQLSTTDVRLELEYVLDTSGGGSPDSADVVQRFDQIELTITYTPPTAFVAVV